MATRACTFPGCERVRIKRRLCRPHCHQMETTGELSPVPPKRMSTAGNCRLAYCVNPVKACGLCQTHWNKRRLGDPNWAAPTTRRMHVSPVVLNFQPLKSTWAAMEAEIRATGVKPIRLVNRILDEWAYAQRNGRTPTEAVVAARDEAAWARSGWDVLEDA
jgi:hypothetical protein